MIAQIPWWPPAAMLKVPGFPWKLQVVAVVKVPQITTVPMQRSSANVAELL